MIEKPVETENKETPTTFDMYSFFSRKDVVLAIAFIVAFLIFSLAVFFLPKASYAQDGWLSKERFFEECNSARHTSPEFCGCAHEKVFVGAAQKHLEGTLKGLAFQGGPVAEMDRHFKTDPAVSDDRVHELCAIAEPYISNVSTGAERGEIEKSYKVATHAMQEKVKAYGFNPKSATFLGHPTAYCYPVWALQAEREKLQPIIDRLEAGELRMDTRSVIHKAMRVCR